MRLMLINDRLRATGGSERTLKAQILGLLARGHQVLVGLPEEEVALCQHEETWQGVDWFVIPRGAGFRSARYVAKEILNMAQDWKADVVEVVNVGGLLGPMGVLDLAQNLPLVHAFRDVRPTCPRGDRDLGAKGLCEERAGLRCITRGCLTLEHEPRGMRGVVDSRLRLRGLKAAHAVLCESEAMLNLLKGLGVPVSKLHLPPLHVEAPASINTLPSTCPPHIFGLGLLSNPTKGLMHLLEAFAAIPSPKTRLRLTGEPGPAWQQAQGFIQRHGLADRIKVLGWMKDHDLHKAFEQCRVLAFPSRYFESFGLAGAEASAFARPVVASDCRGSRDWVQHGKTGQLVDRNDSTAMAKALQLYLADGALADRHGAAGREFVSKHFTRKAMIDSLETVYHKVMAAPLRGTLN